MRLHALGVVVLVASLAVPVFAEGPPRSFDSLSSAERRELESHVQSGLEAYDRRNYVESLNEFERALEILEHPDFVYRVALAYERLGREKKALESYRRFLEMAPETEDREEVERTIRRLKGEIARLKPSVTVRTEPSGALVRVEGREEALGRTEVDARLKTGTHTLVVSKSGYRTLERDVDLQQGESLSLEYDLAPTAASSSETGTATGAFLLLGGGGLAAAGTVGAYLQFLDARGTVRRQKSCAPECAEPETYDRNVRVQKTWEGLTWGAGSLALGAVAGGTIWMALSKSRGEERRPSGAAVRLQPRMSPRFLGVVVYSTVGGGEP